MACLLIAAGAALLLLGVYPFLVYPLLLAALRRVAPRPLRAGAPPAGRVALCVCAYNEAGVIRRKIENMLAQRDAVPGLEILVYVDAAADGTAEIARGFADRITLHVSPERHGKSWGMNQLVALTEAEFVVFTDANVMFAPDAIPRLLAPFADPEVGCVCGHLVYVSSAASATAETGSLYWRLEEAIKRMESDTGSAMGADGSIFAIRRALHQPPPPDIIDDMYVSLAIACDGKRVVRAADARAEEESVGRPEEEFRRKVRIACQALNVHRLLWPRLRRLDAISLWKYVSHKLLRWFAIYLLGAGGLLLVAGLALAGAWWPLATLAALAIGVLAAAAAGIGPATKLVDIAGALVATGLGVWKSLRGERFQTWTPAASIRGGGTTRG
jgi:cellulose synthase/poly-beta-1,6-N-acetylglucosamine synthase-like glycosyltransferase